MIFFTADTHFFHKNVIDYCDRPYRTLDGHPDVEAMNADLVKQWNETVRPQDTVYHLGDFGFGNPKRLLEIRNRLYGKLILVKGNHDHKVQKWLLPNDEVHRSLMVGSVFMTHIPPSGEVPADNKGLIANPVPVEAKVILSGHVHELWDNRVHVSEGRARTIYNVGVDIYKYKPVALEALPGVAEFWKENT